MRTFLLYRKGDLGLQGEMTSMVVRADSEELARKLADEWARSRGTRDLRRGLDGWYARHTFLEPETSYCIDVESIAKPEVLIEQTLDDGSIVCGLQEE